jgi:hypothetical protein
MIGDPDIFRAAKLLIDQHGENALLRAAERADQLLEHFPPKWAPVRRRKCDQTKESRTCSDSP